MAVLILQGWGKDHFGPDASYQVLNSAGAGAVGVNVMLGPGGDEGGGGADGEPRPLPGPAAGHAQAAQAVQTTLLLRVRRCRETAARSHRSLCAVSLTPPLPQVARLARTRVAVTEEVPWSALARTRSTPR